MDEGRLNPVTHYAFFGGTSVYVRPCQSVYVHENPCHMPPPMSGR